MINNFEKFNESNTFSRIKELAKEYVDSGSFSKDIQNIDKSTLMKTFNEVDKAVKKYKGVENLFKKIKSSSETKNESIVGVTFLAIFGLTTELTQRACHDKNDRGCNLPNEFYVTLDKSVRKYHAIFKKEYLLLKTSELIKKLDMGLVRVLLWKFKILLNKGAISKFLDFYEGK